MSLDNTKDIELSDEALESVAGGSYSPSYGGYGGYNTNVVDQTNKAKIFNGGGGNLNIVSQSNDARIKNF